MRKLSSRHHRADVFAVVGLTLALAGGAGQAQELGDLEAKAKLSAAERAKRDADKVYQWIRFHADKAAARPKPVAEAPAPAPGRSAASPAPAPVRPSVAEPAEPLMAQAQEDVLVGPELPLAAASAAAAPEPAAQTLALAPQAAVAPLPMPSPAASALAAAVAPQPEPPEELPEEPLQLLERVEPDYPVALLRGRGSGSVLVQFQVQPDGTVSAAESLKASNQRLVASVLAAVSRWRFAPVGKARVATVEIGFRPE